METTITLNNELKPYFNEDAAGFSAILQLEGTVYRAVKSRKTLRFERGGRGYFAKLHWGISWREFLKNWLVGKTPVISARQEYDAIRHLEAHQVATLVPVGFGERYSFPTRRQSFLITQELQHAQSFHDLFTTAQTQPLTFVQKKQYLKKLALCLRTLHRSGLNHRDCYLVHFYWRSTDEAVVVIDLHRAQIRKKVPKRWLIKDLAGLYFSAMNFSLTKRDYYRFLLWYSGESLRNCLQQSFWRTVVKKAKALYEKEARHPRG